MKIRFPAANRATWRNRFIEISRQVEAGSAPRSLVIAAGLRSRSRIASAGAPSQLRPTA